LAKAIEGLTE